MDALIEAYERLHRTGAEYDGGLSNHGPMAVEALVDRGHDVESVPWLDRYVQRLDPAPAPAAAGRVTDWQGCLGDRSMLPGWIALFSAQLRDRPWTDVLATWWPRLLPGIAGGATHGVIRVGHAVRALSRDEGAATAGPPAHVLAELAHALAYWACVWRQVPGSARPTGGLAVADALRSVPPVPQQAGGVSARLGQLASVRGWDAAQRDVELGPEPKEFLRQLVVEAVRTYAVAAEANPVMLVHMATAPNAVLRVLEVLPPALWRDSAATAWSASAALHAAYVPGSSPAGAAERDSRQRSPSTWEAPDPESVFDRAAQHGDEHVIKLADTALDAYGWTQDPLVLGAVGRAEHLIARP